MARAKRFRTVKALEDAWEAYKRDCDQQTVEEHRFSGKTEQFVSAELRHPITYTIEGFCVHAKISRAQFYAAYADQEPYADTVTRMREECEADARKKFEQGVIPSRLAGLWMSNYGYTTKADARVEGQGTIVICGADDLED